MGFAQNVISNIENDLKNMRNDELKILIQVEFKDLESIKILSASNDEY